MALCLSPQPFHRDLPVLYQTKSQSEFIQEYAGFYLKNRNESLDMNQSNRPLNEEEKLLRAVLVLNSKVLALVLGLLFGLIIFIATNWLILKGGHINREGEYVIGPHLQLLSQFFIGYRVSFWGSIIGFLYGFALGTLVGTSIGWIYNRIVDLRN
jgi:hypothetical protein